MKKKQITIADIAKEAGVSKATISRVLADSPKVKAETREKILAIIKKHSFVPNKLARSLAGTPGKILGIVIEELANYFFVEIADGFDHIVSEAGYSMQISSSKWEAERELNIVKQLISSRVDGVILAPLTEDSESIKMLKTSGIPFLLINVIPKDRDVAYVSCDNYQGGKLAADFFAKMNRPSNILITGFPHPTIDCRVQGFRENFKEWNKTAHYENISTYEEGYEVASILAVRNNLTKTKTAIFITNDNVAIGIITRLLEMGISVPEQVSIVGYDNIKLAAFCRVPLTTISQGIKDIGEIAALELLEMIKDPGKPYPTHKISPQLIIRESAVI